jgi:hypothetical protein
MLLARTLVSDGWPLPPSDGVSGLFCFSLSIDEPAE